MYFSCTSASGVSSGRVLVDDLTYNSKIFLSLQSNGGFVSRGIAMNRGTKISTITKGATLRFVDLQKFSLNFSRSMFVIRVNPLQSFFLSGLSLSLYCLFVLLNCYFQGFFNFTCSQNTPKYREWAPLTVGKAKQHRSFPRSRNEQINR